MFPLGLIEIEILSDIVHGFFIAALSYYHSCRVAKALEHDEYQQHHAEKDEEGVKEFFKDVFQLIKNEN